MGSCGPLQKGAETVSENARYFQFPLEFLAFGSQIESRLRHVVDWCLVERGREIGRSRNTSALQDLVTEYPREKWPDGAYPTIKQHLEIVAAMQMLAVQGGAIKSVIQQWDEAESFHREFVSRHGPSPIVRLNTLFVWEVINGAGLNARELFVLAAVYSVIGAKRYPVRITRDQIRRRALGYKSKAVMDAELPKRTDGTAPLSIYQVGRTLDALHERHFFSRARANERQTFYSLTLRQNALEDALVDSKCWSSRFHATRRQRDTGLMARIAAAKGTLTP